MDLISSVALYILIIAVAINLLLSYVVFRSNRHSATNIIFALLGISVSVWLVFMYLAQRPSLFDYSLILSRSTFFFATPMDVLFFLLAHNLPHEKLKMKKKYLATLFFSGLVIMGLAISPYTFEDIKVISTEVVPEPVAGPALPLVGGFNSILVLSAVFLISKRLKKSLGIEKDQLRLVMYGILLMFGLIIGTIFVPVLIFKNATFVPISPLYALFFLALAAYAIVRHHLFNLKVIATEAFTFILLVTLFAKSLIPQSSTERVINLIVAFATTLFSWLLIKSVRQEVRQREQLEVLTKQLEDANEKLQALDKARADFITIASHQLRTPPATIKWYLASILSGDYGDVPDEAKEQIVKANVTNNGLISLIDDLLNASRIERGKMEFFFEKNNMEPVAKSVFDQLEPMAIMKNLKLVYNKPATPLPDIIFDKEKIRQVINNFIDNAIKYTKTGVITVSMCVDKENAVRVSVTDTGKGIAPDVALSIFEKYTRGKDSVTHSTGLGLGLYVAKIIVEQHHGKIWAESPGVGQGSTFVFSIPIANKLEATTFDLVEQKQ